MENKSLVRVVRPVGRPKLPDGERMEPLTLRLPPEIIEIVRHQGRDWLVKVIRRQRSAQ